MVLHVLNFNCVSLSSHPSQHWESSCIHVKMTLSASAQQRKTRFPISMPQCTWKTRSRLGRWMRYLANSETLYPFYCLCFSPNLWLNWWWGSVWRCQCSCCFLNPSLQYFSVKLSENMKASSFKKLQKVPKMSQSFLVINLIPQISNQNVGF